MKRKLLAIAILAIVFLFSSATTKVLIIGVGEFYDKRVTKLPGAITDVRAFRDAVVELGIAEQDNIQLLENPSLGVLRIEISKFFSGADPQDKLIFYYGGHGQSKGTKTYLVPYDVEPSEIEKTCYNLTDNLSELLVKTKAKEIIMIMDMCYAGSLIEGRPLRDVKYELTPLEKIIKDLGVTMLLSSGASEISLEKKEGGGWFTYYLLKGLKEQAEKGKQEITLRELFEYVKDKVSKETDRQQNPVLKLSETTDGAQNIPLEVILRWEKSEDPEKDEEVYDVYFGQQGNLKLIASNLKTLEYSIKELETSKTYEWKVIAKNNYVAQTESKLQSFSTVSVGTLKWRFQTGGWIRSSPAIGQDGTIYVGSYDYNLYALSPDGTLKWRFQTGDWIDSSPAIGQDGTIYVGSWDRYLYALSPDGTLNWRFQTGDWILSSPAIGQDGTIYVGSDDGNLYAIASDSKGLANSPWPKFRSNLRNTGRFGDK